jgi:hypothetical protein
MSSRKRKRKKAKRSEFAFHARLILIALLGLGITAGLSTAAAQEAPPGDFRVKEPEPEPPPGEPPGTAAGAESPAAGTTPGERPSSEGTPEKKSPEVRGPEGTMPVTPVPPGPPGEGTPPAGDPGPNRTPEARRAPEERRAPETGRPREEVDKAIDRNYNLTLEIYERILEEDRSVTVHLEQRIKANEDMIKAYAPKMQAAEDRLRKLQVNFINRVFHLKRQREAGTITEEVFQRLVQDEETKFRRFKKELAGDVTFYREEIGAAEKRLMELKARLEIIKQNVKLHPPRRGEKAKVKSPIDVLLENMEENLKRLSGFQARHTLGDLRGCSRCLHSSAK